MTTINRIQKTRSIQIKDEEWTKLEQLADRFTEGNKSLMIRQLIRENWAIQFNDGVMNERNPKPTKEQL